MSGIFSSIKAVFVSTNSSITTTAEAVGIGSSALKDLALMGRVASRSALIESIEQADLTPERIKEAKDKASAMGINLD